MRRGGGELRPGHILREPGALLIVPLPRAVFVVPGWPVMMVVPVLNGRFVEDGLLEGRVRATQPGEGRNGLGEDHDQRQDVRGRRPQRPGIG